VGPFESEQEARDAALAEVQPRPGWSILSSGQNRELLTDACGRAGVTLGAYDRRILEWLAGFEDSACAVIAGLIVRAAAAERERILNGPS
jgi:hypothetical protein